MITLVLYYGKEEIPDSICAMMDIPEDETVRKYIQDYKLNLIKLRNLSKEQVDLFRSDFQYIAKFLSTGYNKKELSKELRTSSQKLTHTKDTLYTLASITGDERYLAARETYKEGAAMCEVAETLFQMGVEESKKELEQKEAVLARTQSDLAKAQSMITEKENVITEKENVITEKENVITEKENAITEKENTIAEKDSEIERLRAEIERLKQTQAGQ